jgi:hypothetical protein
MKKMVNMVEEKKTKRYLVEKVNNIKMEKRKNQQEVRLKHRKKDK